jgi:hypothetical protein
LLNEGEELGKIDRLHQMMIKTGLQGASPLGVAAVAGEGDEERRGMSSGSELPGDLISVHPRKTDIEENDVGLKGRGDIQSRGPVSGDAGLVAELVQRLGQDIRGIGVVVNDQDASFQRFVAAA